LTVGLKAGTAIPLNGGAYNLLLNTTSKSVASLAACLTILSYIATAVVSATECITYASNLCEGIDVYWGTIALLAVFCLLSILGITESAVVAVGIFIVHMGSMVFLILVGGVYTLQNPSIFAANLREPLKYDWPLSILFGFCTAMLGVTGFETSANYIEEQQKGVFPKTLFNSWLVRPAARPAACCRRSPDAQLAHALTDPRSRTFPCPFPPALPLLPIPRRSRM
jgi:amino acid transporter